MRTLIYVVAATTLLSASGMLFSEHASAKDFVFGGHKHCWYGEGWHGAGWYWCGYAKREGKGWGGEEGFQGWKH
jgi:hypothetical protein